MNARKKLVFAAVGVFAIVAGAYYFHSSRLHRDVERLIGEAHSRGINTGLKMPERLQYTGTAETGRLAGIGSLRELRALSIGPNNVPSARKLIVSAEPYFAPISEFAALEQYAPKRNLDDPNAFADIAQLSAAIHAEGWRGFLLATDGDFEGALGSIRILKGFMERMQDERYPIGLALADASRDRIAKVALQSAANTDSVGDLDKLLLSVKTIPAIDAKSSFAASVGSHMIDVDNYEIGKYDTTPPTQFLSLRLSFGRTSTYFDAIRKHLLEEAIEVYDNWADFDLPMLGRASIDLKEMGLDEEIISSFKMSADSLRRRDRNGIANRRALSMNIAAYKYHVQFGKLPAVAELEAAGYDATDPWGGEKMTVHQEGGKIWIGAMRQNPTSLAPQRLERLAVLDWRH